MPTTGYEHSIDGIREVPHADRNGRSQGESRDCSIGADALHSHRPSHGRPAKSATASTPYATHSPRGEAFERWQILERHSDCERTRSPPRDRLGQWPPPMTLAPKPHNVEKYYKFHKQNRHMIVERQELRKALHELPDKGQIDQEAHASFERSANPPSLSLEMKNLPRRWLPLSPVDRQKALLSPPGRPNFEGHSRLSWLNKAAELRCTHWYSMGEKAHASPPRIMIHG
ncbi:hypothetical protein Cgig2_000625 [Carnegiea gigantea]|uniref:Uncharacterized protein n=1 Tax=Carnegiea gigantea TaxID=171969 RepID=A0A9Q1QGG0_9CARY|nr:hypothetical protein Cgig2_000625 [Carnegiea gigantea]